MNVQVTVRGNALCLHRECVNLCGIAFKFYEPEFDGEKTMIQAVCTDTGRFSESRKRFFLKVVRGYVARVARKQKKMEVDDV